jgi:hypothetical protein
MTNTEINDIDVQIACRRQDWERAWKDGDMRKAEAVMYEYERLVGLKEDAPAIPPTS